MTAAPIHLADTIPLAAPPDSLCAHCALPVPRGLIRLDQPRNFCCAGCDAAYAIIHGCGLEDYYRIRAQSPPTPSQPRLAPTRRFDEFDDPVFHRLYITSDSHNLRSVDLILEGVTCIACLWLVERLPRVAPGVLDARLDMRRSLVRIRWDSHRIPLSAVARALDSLGYTPHPATGDAARAARSAQDRKSLIRLAVAGACAGNTMLLALALYAGLLDQIEPPILALFRWTSMALGLLSLLWPGSLFLRGAWSAIRARSPHIDLPIALGLTAGALWSALSTLRGAGDIYFDSLALLVFALLVGRFLQQRQQRWASDSLELLFSLTPSSARRLEGTENSPIRRSVPIEALTPGDTLEILAGESFPADGLVIAGDSRADISILTGESRPVPLHPGDHASAGALNLSAPIRLRVTATGAETRIGRLMRFVLEAASRKAPIVLLADRVASRFLRALILLAALTALGWAFVSPELALERAVALLIVACPCALGISTPLTLAASLARAARRGLLIKGADALQRLDTPGLILLDKTGTLTDSTLSVVRWIGDPTARRYATLLEAGSSHPIARAISPNPPHNHDPTLHSVQHILGAGVIGTCDGRRVIVGSSDFLRAQLARIPHNMLRAEAHALAEAHTPVLVAIDGVVHALAVIGHQLRPDARHSLDRIRSLGWRVAILSGDRPQVVSAVAHALAVPPASVTAEATPEQKLRLVEALTASSSLPVVMVGDGVNDAPALAASHVGIAVHGGAEAALSAADISITRPGLEPICELLHGARQTMRTIRLCLAVSIAYNALGVSLAIAGLISPILAALLMPASSLTILTLALASPAFRRRGAPSGARNNHSTRREP